MNNPKENKTLMEQILNEDLLPIEECLTIIDSLDGNIIKVNEVNHKVKEEYE